MTLTSNMTKIQKSGVEVYWNINKKGQGITIAVMDEQPCIMGNMDKEYFTIPPEFESYISKSRTHATMCAQVVHEVAPEAHIVFLPYRSCKQKCVDWLREHQEEIDLISMSLAVGDEVIALQEFNIPVIAAAGNKGSDTSEISKPARFDWAIGVGGWSEYLDTMYNESSYGDGVDCVEYTYIDLLNSKNKVVTMDGTSAACPFVAGMLACYFSDSRSTIPDVYGIRTFIQENCVDVMEIGKDRASGYGRFVLPDPSAAVPATPTPSSLTIVLKLNETIANVNGEKIELDTAAFAVSGVTYVPVRFIAETLGCTVDYSSGVVTIIQGTTTIILTLNSTIVTINGVVKDIGVTPLVKNNRVLLPLRFVAETLGCTVNYQSGTMTITK